MPWMNFDLLDGKAPVGFSLKPDDAERFMQFMRECQDAKQDGSRLEWFMRQVSGHELRRIGVVTSAGLTRADLDAAMENEECAQRALHGP
jgi:hypothetical protein